MLNEMRIKAIKKTAENIKTTYGFCDYVDLYQVSLLATTLSGFTAYEVLNEKNTYLDGHTTYEVVGSDVKTFITIALDYEANVYCESVGKALEELITYLKEICEESHEEIIFDTDKRYTLTDGNNTIEFTLFGWTKRW